jgi:hypothetical protein
MEFLGQVDQLGARVALSPGEPPRACVLGADDINVSLDESHPWQHDDEVILMLRSAGVQVRAPTGAGGGASGWPGRVLSRIYLGERTEYVVSVGTARVRAFGPTTDLHDEGALVQLDFPPEAIRAWPATRPAGTTREA